MLFFRRVIICVPKQLTLNVGYFLFILIVFNFTPSILLYVIGLCIKEK